jgi:hypothetical protein
MTVRSRRILPDRLSAPGVSSAIRKPTRCQEFVSIVCGGKYNLCRLGRDSLGRQREDEPAISEIIR